MKKSRLKLLFKLSFLHYKNLYAGTRLGVFWVILGPLLMLGLYSVTYSVVYKVVLPKYSVFQYIINVYAGIILLLTVMNTLSSSCSILKKDARLRNIGLSIYDIPIKASIVEYIPFLLSSLLLVVLSSICIGSVFHVPLFIIFIILFYAFLLAIIRIFSIFSVLLKDLQFVIPYIGIALLLVTPISYIPSMIPESYKLLFRLNPLYYYCISFQSIAVEGRLPLNLFLTMSAASLVLLYLSGLFFRRSIPLILDSLSQ